MKKQKYVKPAMAVYEAEMEDQVLTVSVTDVQVTGLEDAINLGETGDSWELAL